MDITTIATIKSLCSALQDRNDKKVIREFIVSLGLAKNAGSKGIDFVDSASFILKTVSGHYTTPFKALLVHLGYDQFYPVMLGNQYEISRRSVDWVDLLWLGDTDENEELWRLIKKLTAFSSEFQNDLSGQDSVDFTEVENKVTAYLSPF